MTEVKIMRYEGKGKHVQWTKYYLGEQTLHEVDPTIYTEDQFCMYMKEDPQWVDDCLAPIYYSVIR